VLARCARALAFSGGDHINWPARACNPAAHPGTGTVEAVEAFIVVVVGTRSTRRRLCPFLHSDGTPAQVATAAAGPEAACSALRRRPRRSQSVISVWQRSQTSLTVGHPHLVPRLVRLVSGCASKPLSRLSIAGRITPRRACAMHCIDIFLGRLCRPNLAWFHRRHIDLGSHRPPPPPTVPPAPMRLF
jgi:hypothetical protein